MNTCKWAKDDDGIYNTECKNLFYFDDSSNLDDDSSRPEENRFKYCPYCGKTIQAHKHEHPQDV